MSFGVYHSNHGESGYHRIELHVPLTVPRCPGFADETGLIEPSLVDIDDSRLGLKQRQHDESILLPKNHRPLCIGTRCQFLSPDEA